MKLLNHLIFALLVTTMLACGGGSKSEETPKDSTAVTTETAPKEEVANNTTQQETVGTFLGLEQGDYFYFKVKPDDGSEEKSFMVLNTDETYKQIEADPAKYKDAKVKVYWQAKKQNIPEAGGEMDIQEYIKAEILK